MRVVPRSLGGLSILYYFNIYIKIIYIYIYIYIILKSNNGKRSYLGSIFVKVTLS